MSVQYTGGMFGTLGDIIENTGGGGGISLSTPEGGVQYTGVSIQIQLLSQ